ncbi:MAG: C1 family peptidase [Pseudomonadota bacterium]
MTRLVVILLILSLSTTVFAAKDPPKLADCAPLFTVRLANMLPPHSHVFGVRTTMPPVSCQGVGTCNVHATLALLSGLINLASGAEINFDPIYTYAKILLERAVALAMGVPKAFPIDRGVTLEEIFYSVNNHGLCPKTDYPVVLGHNEPSVLEVRLSDTITRGIPRWQNNFQERTKTNYMETIGRHELVWDIEARQEQTLGSSFGSFAFDGMIHDAHQFAYKYLPRRIWITQHSLGENNSAVVYGNVRPASNIQVTMFQKGHKKNPASLIKAVVKSLQKGRPVLLYIYKNFEIPPDAPGFLAPSSNVDLSKGHAVVIIGYVWNSAGDRITHFILRNSWGKEMGMEGHHLMERDFFEKSAFAAMTIEHWQE